MPLSPLHEELLNASAIAEEVRAARGYRTIESSGDLHDLGFAPECRAPALLMPLFRVGGGANLYQIRPDNPRTCNGAPAKFEVPVGAVLSIDVPPMCLDDIANVARAIYVVEGVRQADSGAGQGLCCINTLGVSTHVGSGIGHQNVAQQRDWDQIPLMGRSVYLAFSTRVTTDPQRLRSVRRLAASLKRRGADVRLVMFARAEDGRDVGLDDFFANGGNLEGLHQLAIRQSDPAYEVDHTGTWWNKPSKDGIERVKLSNFQVTIVGESTITDGIEHHKELDLEAIVDGELIPVRIPAGDFERMDWVVPRLGPRAIVEAGHNVRDRLRHAIQELSTDLSQSVVLSHLGWHDQNGLRVYAHAGGVIGAVVGDVDHSPELSQSTGDGLEGADITDNSEMGADNCEQGQGMDLDRPERNLAVDNAVNAAGPIGPFGSSADVTRIEVQPPAPLALFELPAPPSGDRLRNAIRASTTLLSLEPNDVMYPLFAAIYRAPLGEVGYSLWLDAPTGNHKSVRAALAQQHFGRRMDFEHLPAGWDSTSNALATLAFHAKDSLLVIDDWLPRGTSGDMAAANRDADRLVRAQANGSSRGRCASNGALRPGKSPRALLVCTGESSPDGQSLGARMLKLDCSNSNLTTDDLQREYLNLCQEFGRVGLFAEAMSAFIAWLAPRLDRLARETRRQARQFRDGMLKIGGHPRTSGILADLFAAFELFLEFAESAGAIESDEYDVHWHLFNEVAESLLHDQKRSLANLDPASQFLELLAAAFLSGKAHLTDSRGNAPELDPTRWGWFEKVDWIPSNAKLAESDGQPVEGSEADDEVERRRHWPRGTQIGYWAYRGVYLIPDAALGVAQRMARDGGWTLPIPPRSLGRILQAKGVLLDVDAGRKKLTVRINVKGARPNVYHVDPSAILREPFYCHPALEDDWDGPDLAEELLVC